VDRFVHTLAALLLS